jgi:hypothetical protein
MKKLLLIIIPFIVVSCNEKEGKKTLSNTEEKTIVKTEEKNRAGNLDLKQNGDYSSLFSLEQGDCSFINASDIAAALSISESSITNVSANGRCSFNITLSDNSNWPLNLRWESFPRDRTLSEIKNYTEEGSPLLSQISKTEDTYLCIHPFNSFLMMFNNNYDGAIQINYCPVADYRKLTKEQIEKRKELTITLANYLLQKHKK